MIKAAFYLRQGHYFGFSVKGHAGFDEEGHDVLCAAVSALTINAVNSLEELTSDSILTEECDDGKINCKVMGQLSPESELIIKSLRLGLCKIYEDYEPGDENDEYIRIYFREVK